MTRRQARPPFHLLYSGPAISAREWAYEDT